MTPSSYQHIELNQWLQPRLNPETYTLFTESISLLAEHYGSTDSLAGMLSLLLNDSEGGKEEADQVNYIKEQLMSYLDHAIRAYGVILTEDYEPNDHRFMNQLLSAILHMDTYDDVQEMDDILNLGNPNSERFAELVVLVEPDLTVEDVLLKVDDVLSDFFTKLSFILEPKLNLLAIKRSEVEAERTELVKHLTIAFNQQVLPYVREAQLDIKLFKPLVSYFLTLIDDEVDAEEVVQRTVEQYNRIIEQTEYPALNRNVRFHYSALVSWMLNYLNPALQVELNHNTLGMRFGSLWFKGNTHEIYSFVQNGKVMMEAYRNG